MALSKHKLTVSKVCIRKHLHVASNCEWFLIDHFKHVSLALKRTVYLKHFFWIHNMITLRKSCFIYTYSYPDLPIIKKYFCCSSTKTYFVGTLKNRLNETVLLSTQNMFKLSYMKIIAILCIKNCLSGHMLILSAVYLHHHMHHGPNVIALFFMLNSTEYKISIANKNLKCWLL